MSKRTTAASNVLPFARQDRRPFRNCKVCEVPFRANRINHIFCGQRCARVDRYPGSDRAKKLKRMQIKDAGLCFGCGVGVPVKNIARKHRCEACVEAIRAKAREKYQKLRLDVLKLYGGKCTCCGETETDFLTLDHVNNDGYLDRKKSFYLYVWKNRPTDIQVLCYNCNCSKGHHGVCPHQRRPKLVCEAVE